MFGTFRQNVPIKERATRAVAFHHSFCSGLSEAGDKAGSPKKNRRADHEDRPGDDREEFRGYFFGASAGLPGAMAVVPANSGFDF